ncbi:MAG: efflux RND transporter periplasmic adaptor subunit [Vicinamibacteria bacterium]|nr:efflux RND transporter periplasmic adaptor subunit [Vicinamibacteria bacterium]
MSRFADALALLRSRPRETAAALAAASLLAAVAWANGSPARELPTAVVARGVLVQTADVEGEIASAASLDLGPPAVPDVWEYKIAFLAAEGTAVKDGEPVVRFDPAPLQRQLDQKQAEFDEAAQKIERGRLESQDKRRELDLQLAEARSRLQKAQMKADVPDELRSRNEAQAAALELELAHKEVASLQERRAAVDAAETASLRSLISQRDRAAARVAALETSIERMTVRAPQAGIVIYKTGWRDQKRKVGDSVWWGEKLVALPDLSRLRGEGDVDEADGGAIAAGQPVTLRLEALPDRDFEARVTRIGRAVRRKSPRVPSRVFRVELAFASHDPALRPAMRFRGEIETARHEGVLQVPREAVFLRAAGPVVHVRGWRGYNTVPVELGRIGRGRVEVLAGLAAGDVVALLEPEAAR